MSVFHKVFQGGTCVEVFSPIKKDLLAKAFITKNAKKEYDGLSKTLVYLLNGEITKNQILIPKESKKPLGLIQPCLVMQIFTTESKGFRLEITAKCSKGYRRRITFSNQSKVMQISPLFISLPFIFHHAKAWMHVSIDVHDIIETIWKERCLSIDTISLSGSFSLRQIYTMRKYIAQNEKTFNITPWEKFYMDSLPRHMCFPLKVPQIYHYISGLYIKNFEIIDDKDTISDSKSTAYLTSSKKNIKKNDPSTTTLRSKKDNEKESFNSPILGQYIKPIVCTSPILEEIFEAVKEDVGSENNSRSTVNGTVVLQSFETTDSNDEYLENLSTDFIAVTKEFGSFNLEDNEIDNLSEYSGSSENSILEFEDKSTLPSNTKQLDVWLPSASHSIDSADLSSLARNLSNLCNDTDFGNT